MLRDALRRISLVTYPADGIPVERTSAEAIAAYCAPGVEVRPHGRADAGPHRMAVRWEPNGSEGATLSVDESGWSLVSCRPSLLFALATLAGEEWAERPVSDFGPPGVSLVPAFTWLRNLSDFLVGGLRTARRFDREGYLRQIASQGFTHVTVNGLGVTRPFESGPPGDVYHWFYDYSPDLDQFVDAGLTRGYYPPDYLQANLNRLKEHVLLARRYGLTPGLHINSPRSMPEEFWRRYGFLRGARVDHPRETVLPRYSLTIAHPAVQLHYRELIRAVLREVPDLGFIHIWTNDSGSGFEFVTTLYAGRNGGPYLIREWKSGETIAQVAARNVLTYYRLLHEEGVRVNPAFRVICDLGPFAAERRWLLPGLGGGIDAGEFAFFEDPGTEETRAALQERGVWIHAKLDISDNNVLGVPAPFFVHERLERARHQGTPAILTSATPGCFVPYDINGVMIRLFQCIPGRNPQEVVHAAAQRWVGDRYADLLVTVWTLSDAAVRAYPARIPMSTFGFPWFRLWVRPFVPDIDAVPEEERVYYERFLLATFNNPARIDLNNDMMWNFLTVAEAGELKVLLDRDVLPPVIKAADVCAAATREAQELDVRQVFDDQHDRLVAARCYYTTMRNTVAWTEAVHGYLEATTDEERTRLRSLCRAMVDNEMDNSRRLLELWTRGTCDFMPVSSVGESLHIYGENFGELLKKKLTLMEAHRDDEPRIDPDYMWRMPGGSPAGVP
jgi:hypothetical protein